MRVNPHVLSECCASETSFHSVSSCDIIMNRSMPYTKQTPMLSNMHLVTGVQRDAP